MYIFSKSFSFPHCMLQIVAVNKELYRLMIRKNLASICRRKRTQDVTPNFCKWLKFFKFSIKSSEFPNSRNFLNLLNRARLIVIWIYWFQRVANCQAQIFGKSFSKNCVKNLARISLAGSNFPTRLQAHSSELHRSASLVSESFSNKNLDKSFGESIVRMGQWRHPPAYPHAHSIELCLVSPKVLPKISTGE